MPNSAANTLVKPSAYYAEFIDPLLPENNAFAIRAEQLMRYLFARDFLKKINPQEIYDVACGNGYGMKILSTTCSRVVGFDRSEKLLQLGRERYQGKNIHYEHVDLDNIDFANFIVHNSINKPNAIICFETLEHLANPELLLTSFSQLLKANDYLILSTPNANMEPQKEGKSKDPYHKHLFDKERLTELIQNAHFRIVDFYGQPYTNMLFHHHTTIRLFNHLSTKSLLLFTLLARMLAYPTKHNLENTYSFTVVAQRTQE